MSDSWMQGLSPHEPGLTRALVQAEHHLNRLIGGEKDSYEILHELHDELKTAGNLATEAGRRWALSFLPAGDNEKIGGYFDWDLDKDIKKIVQSTREAPSKEISMAVHEALQQGLHPQHVIGKLTKTYQVDRARDIARTVMLNLYAKGSLREMARHGYEEAIRMEVEDRKVCATCKSLNGKVYKIAKIVDLPNPLTADTHPRCRGTFVPVINPVLTKPDAPGAVKYTQSFVMSDGKMIKDAPNEFAMFLKRFFLKHPLPFHVVFDPKLPVDSRMGADVLRVRPQALFDQDPRELILEAWANRLWPKYQDRFENEYMLLTKMGLVHPSKTVRTAKDYWINEFVAWKTNQLDQPFEILWMSSTVKE